MIVAGIPAYNEEKTIAKVVLLAQRNVDAVVVCDDGSEDLTGDIAQKLGAIVVRHEKNMGYGAALQTLFQKARELNADAFLTLDADGQHDAREIPEMLKPVLKDEADIVLGSRFLKHGNSMPTYRRWGIKFLTKATSGSRSTDAVTDAQCGLRAYNKRALESLELSEAGMGISAEILMKARNRSLRIVEVPISVHYHDLETSTQNPLSHGLGVLSTIIRIVVEERPLFFLGIPGMTSLLVGVAFGIYTVHLYVSEGSIVTTFLLITIAFTLIGVFTTFTAVTLYAVLRLTQKLKASDRK